MKFIVIGKGIDYGGPFNPAEFSMISEDVILPSFEILKEWEEKKRIVGGFFRSKNRGNNN